ncbi:(2Fe-2S)-binding protein [Desulforhopalus singaporensis]|uniref:2Fe-2S iron-sulfur cluster binding domain-containing protein n=1 Tax=Desulforhopalus singaporensis TaxID=91360 RepID=A0A1H0W4Q1_9BACT|nr:(2Fe-2S)-binding protein [Desulforhopalus singaporensis]SDP85558.1 2Fe-2S iron-sulfur cluster binding domain-containing protein [Desulforhopalus singaporensis]
MSKKETFTFELDGEELKAYHGQTIAEALLVNQKMVFRKTRNRNSRSAFCGMGVCYECLMKVDGISNVRTCMTQVHPNCKVEMLEDGQSENEGSSNDR